MQTDALNTRPAFASIAPTSSPTALSGQSALAPSLVPALSGVSLSLADIVSGRLTSGSVTLSQAAPEPGVVVTLSSLDAVVPASVTVPAGKKTVSFPVTTAATTDAAKATISAAYGGITRTADLKLKPASLTGLVLSPANAGSGETQTGTVMLSGPAPPGGVIIPLSSNNPQARFPRSVTVAPGSQSAMFSVLSNPVLSNPVLSNRAAAASKNSF